MSLTDPAAGMPAGAPPIAPATAPAVAPVADALDARIAAYLAAHPQGTPGVTASIPPQPLAPLTAPAGVPISKAEFDRLTAIAKQFETQQAETAAALEKDRIKEGKWTEVVAEYKGRLELETRKAEADRVAFRTSLRDKELVTELAKHRLIPGTAAQLVALLRDQFEVREEGGQLVVMRGFETAEVAVKSLLATPQFAHFLAATSQGGVGPTGAAGSVPTPVGNPGGAPEPKNLGEYAILKYLEREKAAQGKSSVPGFNPTRGFAGFGNSSGAAPLTMKPPA